MKKTRHHPPWHSIDVNPPANLPHIRCVDKLNPVWWFKNSDEPVPPTWYKPKDKWRVLKWHFRNPLHNFDHYVIGVADKHFVRSGWYPAVTSNPSGGWNIAISKYKWLRLPFVDYRRGKFEFYFGWRTRGNFGIKVNVK